MPHRFPSLALLLKLHDAVNEVICVVDGEGRFIYLNQASFKIWGYEPAELIGRKCIDFIVPEDQDNILSVLKAAPQSTEVHRFENRYYRKDGSIVIMSWEGGWDSTEQLLYCTGKDVTEQKRLEQIEQQFKIELTHAKERLERFLDRITDGFIGLDANARITYWNTIAEKLAQIPRSQALGKVLWDIIPEPMKSIYQQHYQTVSAQSQPMSFEIFSERVKRWIEINTYASGSGLTVFFRDVTEKRKLREQILHERELHQKRMAAAVIKATEEERAQVGRELHDNVNQVLTTVKLYTELCLADPEKSEPMLKKSSLLLQDSINEIRGLSKRLSAPSLGGIRLRDSIGELVEAINASRRLLVYYENDVEELEVTDEVHVAIYRILQEQLTNIIKHANASTAIVRITIENEKLAVTIHDNGRGFDPATVRRGVGLESIASRVQGVNGDMQLTSAPGEGCTLAVAIPLEEA